MKKYQFLCIKTILLSTPLAFANIDPSLKDIVFSANSSKQNINTVGSSINIITEEQLADGNYQYVSDALATVPGVNIIKTGEANVPEVLIRGLGSNNILIMVDDVAMNDTTSPNHSFDLRTINVANIERIEVLKGPQSAVYGAHATGGVVRIFTKRGGPQSTTISVTGGSYGYVQTSLNNQGEFDKFKYSLALGTNQEHGRSIAASELDKSEHDRFRNRNASFSISYAPQDWISFDFMTTYYHKKTDLDSYYSNPDGSFEIEDEASYYQKTRQWIGHFAINTAFFDKKWLSTVSYNAQNTKRDYYDWGPNEKYTGKSETVNWNNTVTLHKNFQTIFGLTYTNESLRMKNPSNNQYVLPKKTSTTKSAFINQQLNFDDRFFNNIAIRYDHLSTYGSKVTYRLTSRYNINDKIAIKGSYGTGFTPYTEFQLYAPNRLGNEELKAETSKGFDIGFVLTPFDHTTIDLTYFQQSSNDRITHINPDLINYPWGRFVNVKKTKSHGVEFVSTTQVNKYISFGLNYTYTDAADYYLDKNSVSKGPASDTPKHLAGGHINFKPNERWNLTATTLYSGTFIDDSHKLKNYWVMNVSANYKINDTVSLTAQVNNLFDKHYLTSWGHAEKRINGSLGVKISF